MKAKHYILSIIILTLIAFFVISPTQGINATLNGFLVWANALLPALFPFFFFTKLLTSLGFVESISKYLQKFTQKLFNTPGISAYVYLMSILSGYPVGAKITSDLYEHNIINYGQACRITTFTSTSGPLFIIGTVGIGMNASAPLGYIVLACHFIGAILNGLLYRNYANKNQPTTLKLNSYVNITKINSTQNKTANLLEDAMYSSIKSILIIGGYVAIFFMIISMLNVFGILNPINFLLSQGLSLLNQPPQMAGSITNGIIEITKGCLDLSKLNLSFSVKTIVTTAIITFGVFSVHMQALTFLKKFNIKIGFYLLQKLTHTLFSVAICAVFVVIF